MRLFRYSTQNADKTRIITLGFLSLFIISTIATLTLPQFGGKALASTSVDLYQNPNPADNQLNIATCEPYFASVPKSMDLLNNYFTPNTAGLIADSRLVTGSDGLRTKIGYKVGTVDQSVDYANRNPLQSISIPQIQYVLNGANSSNVPVIKFKQASSPMPGGNGTVTTGPAICERYVMLPVSNREWRGWIGDRASTSIYMRYAVDSVNTTGTGQTVGKLYNYELGADKNKFLTMTIDQAPPFTGAPGSGIPINVVDATWQNVSTLTVAGSEGGTYTKQSWNARSGRSIYFLSSADATPNADRAALVNAPRCEDPFAGTGSNPIATCGEADNRANCVPFIAINQPINFSRNAARDSGNLNQLQSWINALPSGSAKYYTYNNATDCLLLNPEGTDVRFGAVGRANLWFAYSKVNDRFLSFFKTGDGNEVIYLGEYVKSADRVYSGGTGGCAGVINFGTSTDTSLEIFTVNWQLAKEGLACTAADRFYGTVQVSAIGGAAGEEAFNDTAPGVGPDTTINPLEDERIGCDFTWSPLSWIICPFVRGAMEMVGLFDGLINQMLNIETGRIFDDTTETGAAYHKAWRVFRTFALVLIVVGALIMVIAQAAGLEILDAYTIKKILPRLLIVTIGIALSWELMRFVVNLSNDLGQGVRGIIYAPFASLDSLAKLNAGSQFVLLLLGSGAILTYGIIGILSLVVTALLASLVAVALMAFREIGIIFLIIIAPLAIAAAILPFTQKLWKFWHTSFVGLLMVFVFISAFIAIGRVFSVTAATDSNPLYQLIAVIAYFAPYFLIPFAFKLAGGAVATIAGIANDRSRGMFDRLKNFRANNSKARMKRLGEGNLFNSESKWTRYSGLNAVNRVGAHVGAMSGPGGWRAGFGQKGRAKMANNAFAKFDQYASEDANFKAQVDNEDAMAAHAVGNSYRALAALEWFQTKDANGKATGIADDAKIKRAIAASSTIQMTGRSRAAALDAVAASGKIFAAGRTGRLEHKQMVAGMAGGNEMLQGALMGASQWRARTSGGRQDIGRGATDARAATSPVDDAWESLKEANLGTLSQQKPWGVEGMVQDAITLLQPGAQIATSKKADGSVATARALTDTERQHIMDIAYGAQFNPYTNAYQQEEISKLMSNPGVQDLVAKAADNYRAKLGGAGGGNPQEAAQSLLAQQQAAAAQQQPGPGATVRPQQPPEPPPRPPGEDAGYL